MPTIAVFNQRIGVGKTTTALNLLAAIAQRGERPWGIDLHPDAELSRTFGVDGHGRQESMSAFFTNEAPLTHVAHVTKSGIVLCPGHAELRELDRSLGKSFAAVTRLRRGVREPGTATGPVIIDCPATLGSLTLNAIFASDLVLVPVCDDDAVQAAIAVDRALNALSRAVRRPLARRYVLTRCGDGVAQVVDRLGRAVNAADILPTRIAERAELAESPAYGLDVFRHAPDSPGAQHYQALLDDLVSAGKLG